MHTLFIFREALDAIELIILIDLIGKLRDHRMAIRNTNTQLRIARVSPSHLL